MTNPKAVAELRERLDKRAQYEIDEIEAAQRDTLFAEASTMLTDLQRERDEARAQANDVDHDGKPILWSARYWAVLDDYKYERARTKAAESSLREAVLAEREYHEAADYLINRLDNMTRGKLARNMDEAWARYVNARSAAAIRNRSNE